VMLLCSLERFAAEILDSCPVAALSVVCAFFLLPEVVTFS